MEGVNKCRDTSGVLLEEIKQLSEKASYSSVDMIKKNVANAEDVDVQRTITNRVKEVGELLAKRAFVKAAMVYSDLLKEDSLELDVMRNVPSIWCFNSVDIYRNYIGRIVPHFNAKEW